MAAPARAAAASLEASIQSLMLPSDKVLVQPVKPTCSSSSSFHPTWLVLVLLECHSCCLLLLQATSTLSVLRAARLRNRKHGAN